MLRTISKRDAGVLPDPILPWSVAGQQQPDGARILCVKKPSNRRTVMTLGVVPVAFSGAWHL